MRKVYLDNASTNPILPEVRKRCFRFSVNISETRPVFTSGVTLLGKQSKCPFLGSPAYRCRR